MENYSIEISGTGMSGTITCGSEEGYNGSKKYELEEILTFMDEINIDLEGKNIAPIPCIITKGTLIGRTPAGEQYREDVYKLNFSWSPRLPQPKREDFYNTLISYADKLGHKTKQVRVYVEFEGNTDVLLHDN